MKFEHAREYLNQGDLVIVNCSHQCNVRLMDDTNFSRYKRAESHRYYGGFYEKLPARIGVPHSGFWNVTLDLGGGSANIKFSIDVLKAT